MHLNIKPLNDISKNFYFNHGHFHSGDAGLDLYVIEDMVFEPGETKLIKLGISCEPTDGKAYFSNAEVKYFKNTSSISKFNWIN